MSEVAKSSGSKMVKAPKAAKPNQPAALADQSWLDRASALMEKCLGESTVAAGLATALRGQQLSSELVAQMDSHSKYMTEAYGNLAKLVGKKCDSEKVYGTLFEIINKKMEWFESRRKIAQHMKARAIANHRGSTPNQQATTTGGRAALGRSHSSKHCQNT
jgi:hypothetical protein